MPCLRHLDIVLPSVFRRRRHAGTCGRGLYLEAMEARVLLSANLTGAINTPLGTAPSGLVVADFNSDGRLDIATAAEGVDVRLGNGDGSFLAPISNLLPTLAITQGLVAGDFNGDGNVDLVAIEQGVGTPLIHTLLGNGDGTFNTTTTTESFPTGFSPPIAADVNGDGKLDLVALNAGAGTVGVLLGNGDGTFQNIATVAAVPAAFPIVGVQYLATGDFNHDGNTDLVINGGTTDILLGNGDGTFGAPAAISATPSPGSIATSDLNADGNLDIVAGTVMYFGNGDGTFTQSTSSLAGSTSTLIADLNGDGAPDLLSTFGNQASVSLNNGDGTFQPEVTYADGSARFLNIADANGDGHADLIGLNSNMEQVTTVFGNGDGTFQAANVFASDDINNPSPGLKPNLAHPSQFFGDFNGDGIQDFAVANTAANTISISFGKADGTFQAPISFVPQTLAQAPRPQIVTVSDFNGDGKDDIIVYTPGLSGSVTLGGGENHGIGGITGGTPSSWTLFLSNGDGTFTPSTISNPLFVPTASDLSVGNVDLDGDGTPDVIVASNEIVGLSRQPVGLLSIEYTTHATKIGSQEFQLGGEPNAIYTPDLNGDGLPDILITTSCVEHRLDADQHRRWIHGAYKRRRATRARLRRWSIAPVDERVCRLHAAERLSSEFLRHVQPQVRRL